MSISPWPQLLLATETLEDDRAYTPWFDAVARRLLCGCRVMVGGEPHRFTEIEFYYHGGTHLDPFTHRDPIQKSTGLWYFHRTNGVYRGGSFKGVDLTFGGPGAFGGVLIRGIEAEGGAWWMVRRCASIICLPGRKRSRRHCWTRQSTAGRRGMRRTRSTANGCRITWIGPF